MEKPTRFSVAIEDTVRCIILSSVLCHVCGIVTYLPNLRVSMMQELDKLENNKVSIYHEHWRLLVRIFQSTYFLQFCRHSCVFVIVYVLKKEGQFGYRDTFLLFDLHDDF